MNNYPHILLFGHSFNNYTGMGITLTNLFADWPKENIVVWAEGIEPELCDAIRPCAKYIGSTKSLSDEARAKRKLTIRDKCIDFLLAPDSEPVQKQFKKRPRILVHDMKILSMQVIL